MPKEPLSTTSNGQFSLDRCKALADGVFAIVVTLLVLGIDIPADHSFSEQGLIVFLERIGFHLLIYGISFWLAATYWVQHTAIMNYFRHGNRTLVWLNLLLLFPVTLLPFVTDLKGTFRDEPLVIMLFGFVQIFIGLALILLWNYSDSHPELLSHPVDSAVRRKITRRMFMSPIIISLLAIAVSFLSIHISSLLFLSIPLYYLSHRDIDVGWADPGMDGD
jgi:uncharacterized membrane protein